MPKANFTAQDLNSRVDILKKITRRDSEANLIEKWLKITTVWANVQVKSARQSGTPAGEKETIGYIVTIRFNKALLQQIDGISIEGKDLALSAPPYQIENKFIILEAVETYGKKQRACEFSELP